MWKGGWWMECDMLHAESCRTDVVAGCWLLWLVECGEKALSERRERRGACDGCGGLLEAREKSGACCDGGADFCLDT